jgi:hypothetical protein
VSIKNRRTAALILMGVGIVVNIIILVRGEESVGWPVAAIVFLGAASVALLAERRR